MIPDNHNDYNDIDSKKLDLPKRFNVGYFVRETAELFHAGWTVGTRRMLEYRQQQEAAEDRKYIVDRLEWKVYCDVENGTPEQKLEALKYFQRKKEVEQQQDQQPYTWGEQISSVALNAAFLSALAVLFSLSATWSCGRNQSQFCKDVRATTGGVVRYFSDPTF